MPFFTSSPNNIFYIIKETYSIITSLGTKSLPHESLNVKRKFSNEQPAQIVVDTIPPAQQSVKHFFKKTCADIT